MTATLDAPTTTTAPAQSEARRALSGAWPLAAFGAAVTTFVFTTLSSHWLEEGDTGSVASVYAAVDGDGSKTQLGVVTGFLSVLLLAVVAVGFGRFLTARAPQHSAAAQLARLGMNAAVGTVAVAAALKAVYRGGLPDHMDHTMYTRESVAVLQIVVDQYQWAAYWTLVLAMAAAAWLGLKDRVLPRSYAVVSAVTATFVLGMTLVLGLPYSSGLIAPVWLVATGIMALGVRRRLA